MNSPAPISKLSLGLLGFLGIKNFGQYPNQLLQHIQPTWDQLELLTGAHGEYQKAAPAIAGTGPITLFTVPETEVWYLCDFASRLVTPAGATLSAALMHGLANAGGAGGTFALITDYAVLAASQQRALVMPRPIFVGPGEQLILDVTVFSGAPTGTTALRILRMPI